MPREAATGFVLDAGAWIAIESGDAAMLRLMNRAAQDARAMVTSAGVVAQVWRGGATGGQVRVALALRRVTVVDLTASAARAIGVLLGRSKTRDAIDAHVVLLARGRGWPVLTSDPGDLLALAPDLVVERV